MVALGIAIENLVGLLQIWEGNENMVGILIICFKSFCNIPSIQNIISHLKEFGKQLDLIKKRTDKWKETKYASVINIVQKQKCQIKSTKADQQLWCAGNNWASLKQLEWSVVPTSRVGLLATLSIHKTVSIIYTFCIRYDENISFQISIYLLCMTRSNFHRFKVLHFY